MDYREQVVSSQRLRKANEVLKRGKIKDALSMYADIIEEEPNNPLVYYNMGVAFVEREDYDLARQVFSHCLRLGLQDSRIQIGLGICALHFDENDQALACFQQVNSQEPYFKEALIGQAYAYMNKGEKQQALSILHELKKREIWNQELSLIEKKVKMLIQPTIEKL